MTEAVKSVFDSQVTFGDEAGPKTARQPTYDLPVMRYRPEKKGFKALTDVPALTAKLDSFGFNPAIVTSVKYLLNFVAGSEDDCTPLQDMGIDIKAVDRACLPGLAYFWADRLGVFFQEVANAGKAASIYSDVVYILVNLTVKSIFSPHRSVSSPVLTSVKLFFERCFGSGKGDVFEKEHFIWGMTYAELGPIFGSAIGLESVQAHHYVRL